MTSHRVMGRLGAATAAVILLLGGAACGAPSNGPGSAKADQTLKWALPAPPNSLDITKAINATSYTVQSAGLETLVHPEAGQIKPWLAKSWTSPDPLTYVFELRDDVTFWNGAPMTADDVAFSIERNISPSSLISYDFTAVSSATATGAHEVTVKLKHPDPLFLQVAIGTDALVVQKSYVQAAGDQIGTPDKLNMGTGPLEFKSFSKTSGVTLDRYDKYWGDKPTFAGVQFTTISDPETMRIALTQGQVDGSFDGTAAHSDQYKSNKTNVSLAPGKGYLYMSMDVRQAPFNDVHVRKAIALALDKQAITKATAGNAAQPADALMTRPQFETMFGQDGVDFTSQVPSTTTNLDAAKAELAQSKTPKGISTSVRFNADGRLAFQVIQQQLAPLGIVLNGQQVDDNQFYSEIGKISDPQGLRIILSGAASTDPWESLRSLLGDADTAGYSSDVTKTNLDILASTADPAQRKSAVVAISKDIADQAPFIPLYTTKQMLVLGKEWAYDNFTPRGSGWILKLHPAS
ncbi:ABC transporter substrate-binding protein [Saccharopolyspora phatthalungensis]|uniref:Peptide/nickel transport system substrate-binding protein n=1 Tax=Saccharopolyspora phatthalungensis TaxID=664693 RepID=A0A840QKD7_9PSEU|nr:ABC transporter substrate-binding protein [Saccharopolyspora phatthalungensis]MBB5159815.1 peptide/nickel transport system substrate-binding protein [Saccharopolyspora phatthalungensis]